MAWLCRVDTLCDTITTLIYDLMDGPCLFSRWGIASISAGGQFCVCTPASGHFIFETPSDKIPFVFIFTILCILFLGRIFFFFFPSTCCR